MVDDTELNWVSVWIQLCDAAILNSECCQMLDIICLFHPNNDDTKMICCFCFEKVIIFISWAIWDHTEPTLDEY